MTKNDLLGELHFIALDVALGEYDGASKKLKHLIELVSTKDTVVPKNKALGTVDGKNQMSLLDE